MNLHQFRSSDAGHAGLSGKPGKRRKAALLAVAAALVVAGSSWPSHAKTADAAADSSAVQFNVASSPFTIDGRKAAVPTANLYGETYIGLRPLNEQLGLQTSWNGDNHEVTVEGRGRTLVLDTEDGSYRLNGQHLYGLPVMLRNGSTYMPLRFLLEQMGYLISYDPATKTIGIETIAENALTIGSAQIEGKLGDQTWSVSYPIIAGYADEEVQRKINDYLKKEAEAYTESGKQEIAAASADNASAEEDNPDIDIPPVTYDGTFFITYNEAGKLSLYVDYYLYTGGAHGITARVPYTFDLKTGDTLTLKQAAGDNAGYVSIINKAIKEQIAARDLTLLEPFETIEPDRDFFLRHNKLVVYFTPYEYTAYAEGFPEFALPFTAFK